MNKINKFFKNKLKKVNIQVSLLTCSLVIFSCLIIYLVTSGIMLSTLTDTYDERAKRAFETVEPNIDERLYEDTVSNSTYNSVMSYLAEAKQNMAVSAISVMKKKSEDKIVYLLDTESERTGVNIRRCPVRGKLKESVDSMYVLGIVRSGKFYNMPDGYRYMNFYPVYNKENHIKGVVCIAIDTDNVYTARLIMYILLGIILLLCCLISVCFSNIIFRKISNPLYQDASNTDNLTGLKNKNSFSVHLHNIEIGTPKRFSIITIDLNGLKHINDTRGHQAGDMYIQRASRILKSAMEDTDFVGYRIGGDEFSVIGKDKTIEEVEAFVRTIEEKIDEGNKDNGMILTMSIGYARFDAEKDRNFSMTIERSDAMMYENKRLYYQKKNQL